MSESIRSLAGQSLAGGGGGSDIHVCGKGDATIRCLAGEEVGKGYNSDY